MRVNLEAEGIETCEAADGIEALSALERERADAIISDILMPHMDGYQLCQKVRKNDRFGDMPFIFYTSTYTSPGDEKLAIDCGADRYIKKPAPVGEIMSAIRELSDPGRQRVKSGLVVEESLVMREYNEALVRKLEERNDMLEKARAEIALANEELERRVQERTAELLLANQELEAFSHSIAHDLRSPLHAIDTFSYLLVEECQGKVSEKAMESLKYISVASGRMNDLTNDLLRLSRASHDEITVQEVDLGTLAMAVLQDLQAARPRESVEWVVGPNLTGFGDIGLLRIVLENLLGNAWKFTGKTGSAQIEFDAERGDGETVFFVRDNGAGFDMASADKLFSPFGRLHPLSEFAGTGIGLSTVHRAIARQGGRIWAEAEQGRGATFYFTLGASSQTNSP